MTSYQATLVNAGYGQLALRDQNGKITQKWTLGQPKCVIGAHANCNVRCMLPGIADHHLLLVIGARQIYMRALAAGVERDGIAVNELVLSGDQSELAFRLAGYHFEYSRGHSTTPIAKSFVAEGASLVEPEPAKAPRESAKRLRFTFVQALEKNRDRSEAASLIASAAEAAEAANERPAWVEEIVRDALRPVELRLKTIAEPINNLERQLRRQRARLRKQQQARKLTRHGAHEAGQSQTQHLLEAQETIQKIVADQSARLEVVNERVADVVSQLASLERIVSAENVQQREVVSRTSQSGEEIIRLQREMMALVSALQTRIAQPAIASDEDARWRVSIQRQLEELHQSLGILDEIRSSLELAVSQNRQLSQDFGARWQTIEEIARRPLVIQSLTPPAASPVPSPSEIASPETASSETASSALSPLAADHDQPIELVGKTSPHFDDEQALLEVTALEPNALESAELEPESLESTRLEPTSLPSALLEPTAVESAAIESPAATGDFRVADEAISAEPVPLPSWWTEDPVVPNEAYGSTDLSRLNESPAPSSSEPGLSELGLSELGFSEPGLSEPGFSASGYSAPGFATTDAPYYDVDQSLPADLSLTSFGEPTASRDERSAHSNGWQPTEYEQEAGPHELPWSSAAPGLGEVKNDYPELDVPQLLTSAIVETPVSLQAIPRSYPEPAQAGNKQVEQTFDDDIRDIPQAVSESASAIEHQLQQWLSDDYQRTSQNRSPEVEGFGSREIEQAAIEAQPAVDESYFTGMLGQVSATEEAAEVANDTNHEEYAVSAFSAERLAIEEISPDLAPAFDTQAEPSDPAADEIPYHRADPITESHALSSPRPTDEPVAAEGGDESVEDYMRRLLARMRGVSESEVSLPGLDRQQSPKPAAKPQASLTDSDPTNPKTAGDTEPVSGAWTEPFDPMTYVPRVSAPENNRDIDALRELANTSARSAIHVSARRKHLTAIMIKSGVALVGLAAGAALVSINGFRINVGLIATLASFLVAVIWGYDALATLRPLLQASRGAKSHITKVVSEKSEQEAS